jgi:hypothetical protein
MAVPGFFAELSLFASKGPYSATALSVADTRVRPASYLDCVYCLQLAPIICGDNLACILGQCRYECRSLLTIPD